MAPPYCHDSATFLKKWQNAQVGGWTYYASGSSRPGTLEGFADAGWNVGIALNECGAGCQQSLRAIRLRHPKLRLFVDSGAFSEFGPKGVPITDREWAERLALATRIARAWGPRALIVAPDKVGDQQATLRRLKRFAPHLKRFRQAGSEVAVVLQRGDLEAGAFLEEAARHADLATGELVAAFPMKKAATPLVEVEAFLRARRATGPDRVRRVHLLGLGPQARRIEGVRPSGRQTQARLSSQFPSVTWSWDSNVRRSMVARSSGARRLTRAEDAFRAKTPELAVVTVVQELAGGPTIDLTEDEPSTWLDVIYVRRAWPRSREKDVLKRLETLRRGRMSRADLRRFDRARRQVALEEIGIKPGDELQRWLDDPDAFAREDDDGLPRSEWDVRFRPFGALERLYQEAAVLVTPYQRQRSAIVAELSGEAPAAELEDDAQRILPGLE